MSYYTYDELKDMGFKFLGNNIKISKNANIYNHDQIEIGDNSRIDDFCLISGRIAIGSYCHITPMCLLAGGVPGIYLADFVTLAYGVKVFAQSDDYSGLTLTNSLIPKKYKNEIYEPVYLRKHVIIGTNSVVFPGVDIAEGCSVGAMTLINKSTHPWSIYVGNPARKIKERKKEMLDLETNFLKDLYAIDSI